MLGISKGRKNKISENIRKKQDWKREKRKIGKNMILIAIGSNLNSDLFGTPRKNCEAALSVMKNYFEILNISNFYKTEPIPKSSQLVFVNSVVNVRCEINPEKFWKYF